MFKEPNPENHIKPKVFNFTYVDSGGVNIIKYNDTQDEEWETKLIETLEYQIRRTRSLEELHETLRLSNSYYDGTGNLKVFHLIKKCEERIKTVESKMYEYNV